LNPVNWQAFEDGTLSVQEMDRARELLSQDPAAQEELNGFRAFRESVRRQGLDEDVPRKDLNRLLKEVVRQQMPAARFSWVRVSIPAAAALFLAITLWWFKHDPMAFATTPVAAELSSTEYVEAKSWIQENTGFHVPDLRLPPEATLVMARYGEQKEWACVDFMHDGNLYFLYMKPDGSALGSHPSRVFDGRGFYEGQGVGWKTPGMSYYLKGGTREGRWSFATHLAPQTQGIRA